MIIFIGHFSLSYLKPFYISVIHTEVSILFENYYFWCEWISHNFIFVIKKKSHCLIPKISLWHFQNEIFFFAFSYKTNINKHLFPFKHKKKGKWKICVICARVNSRNFKYIKVYIIFYLCNPVNKTIGGKIFFGYLPYELCPAITQVRYVVIVQNWYDDRWLYDMQWYTTILQNGGRSGSND